MPAIRGTRWLTSTEIISIVVAAVCDLRLFFYLSVAKCLNCEVSGPNRAKVTISSPFLVRLLFELTVGSDSYDSQKRLFSNCHWSSANLDSPRVCQRAWTSSFPFSHSYAWRPASSDAGESRKRRVSRSTYRARLESSLRVRGTDWQLHMAGSNKLRIHKRDCFRVHQYGIRSINSDAHCRQGEWSA